MRRRGPRWGSPSEPRPRWESTSRPLRATRAPATPGRGGRRVSGKKRKLSTVQLLPWGMARKVEGVGKNYAAHAKELHSEVPKEPLLLVKVSSALVGHGHPIELPPASREVHHEAELAVVI